MLEMNCNKCAVSSTCPSNGSSPMVIDGITVKCRILGGYGRNPMDASALCKESLAAVENNGPCLTLAEVPGFDDGRVVYNLVKIFSKPVLSDREKNPIITSSDAIARSHT